jgi:hypothetical protein
MNIGQMAPSMDELNAHKTAPHGHGRSCRYAAQMVPNDRKIDGYILPAPGKVSWFENTSLDANIDIGRINAREMTYISNGAKQKA